MKNYNVTDVDSYIESADIAARPKLNELREIVKSTVPKADEGISWGIPFYKYHGLLAGFAAFKKHVSFGLVSALDGELREALEAKGYATGKKTIQIRFDQKTPTAEIKRFLKARAKLNEAMKASKQPRK